MMLVTPEDSLVDLLPTQATSSSQVGASWYWKPALKLWVYWGLFAPGNQIAGACPFAKLGSRSGGRSKSCGNPSSQLKPEVIPPSWVWKMPVLEKPSDGAFTFPPPWPPVGKKLMP